MKSKTQPGDGGRRPGIRQIAKSLGISIGTVSRSLNNRYGVNSRTRELVLAEARKLGYVPNQAARNLKDHPSLTVGLVFSPFKGPAGEINPAALGLIESFKKAVAKAGMAVKVVMFVDDDELKHQTDGINVAVFYGHFEHSSLQVVHDSGIPAVLLQLPPSGLPDQISLSIDTRSAGAAAVEYLAALGHEKIGIVLSPLTESHGSGLFAGYRMAQIEFHLHQDNSWVCEMTPEMTSKEGGRLGMERILKSPNRPTAVIFASDWMALGGLRAAADAGLRVPSDISIIGFDDLEISSETSPSLTTFDVHVEKEVEALTQLAQDLGLRSWEEKNGSDREVLLAPDLIRRKSCACLRSQKNR
ncbi:MAG: LacI family transcriptional regulator [Verrucomicrobiaceae bacterium]|nr:MAG: LacI family transcriptional regulator [Verrucomicrobiaceae bacterium]